MAFEAGPNSSMMTGKAPIRPMNGDMNRNPGTGSMYPMMNISDEPQPIIKLSTGSNFGFAPSASHTRFADALTNRVANGIMKYISEKFAGTAVKAIQAAPSNSQSGDEATPSGTRASKGLLLRRFLPFRNHDVAQ